MPRRIARPHDRHEIEAFTTLAEAFLEGSVPRRFTSRGLSRIIEDRGGPQVTPYAVDRFLRKWGWALPAQLVRCGRVWKRMIAVIACFDARQARIANRAGFHTGGLPRSTFSPHFLDNGFVQEGVEVEDWIAKAREDRDHIEVVVIPDGHLGLDLPPFLEAVKRVYPVHELDEIREIPDDDRAWAGMPRRRRWRGYTVGEFLELTRERGLKRWLLGLTDGFGELLTQFEGFDTSIPSFYADKGKVWEGWSRGRVERDLEYNEKFERSVDNLKTALVRGKQQTTLF